MKRVTAICRHTLYVRELREIQEAEKERIFCRHDMQHFLDVARIGWILCLERKLAFSREIVYAAALLHDIGRGMQYRDGTPHDEAGALLAGRILPECGFDGQETEEVCRAIEGHRISGQQSAEFTGLGALLKEADHMGRSCFACGAEPECYWPKEKKNLEIRM